MTGRFVAAAGRGRILAKLCVGVAVAMLGALATSGIAAAHETTPQVTCQAVTLPFIKFKESSLPVHIQVAVDSTTVLDTTPTLSFVNGANTYVYALSLSGQHTVRTWGSWVSSEGPGGWDTTVTLDCPVSQTTQSPPPPSPPKSNGPDHVGYCDQNNVFQQLTVDQPMPEGWRPADVDKQTGAIFCAQQPAPQPAVTTSTPPTTTTTPTAAPSQQGVAGATKTIRHKKHVVKKHVVKKHVVKKHVVKKHKAKPKKKHVGILGAHRRGQTLPFTK